MKYDITAVDGAGVSLKWSVDFHSDGSLAQYYGYVPKLMTRGQWRWDKGLVTAEDIATAHSVSLSLIHI